MSRQLRAHSPSLFLLAAGLSGDEFVKIMLDQMSLTHEEGMKKLWTALDKDNDGFINPADVREVMTNTGMKLSHEEVDDMMRYAGIFDESTPINVQQFRKLMMAT